MEQLYSINYRQEIIDEYKGGLTMDTKIKRNVNYCWIPKDMSTKKAKEIAQENADNSGEPRYFIRHSDGKRFKFEPEETE